MRTLLVDVSWIIAKSKQVCVGKYGILWIQTADDRWITYWKGNWYYKHNFQWIIIMPSEF
jgi:hypothetical protein